MKLIKWSRALESKHVDDHNGCYKKKAIITHSEVTLDWNTDLRANRYTKVIWGLVLTLQTSFAWIYTDSTKVRERLFADKMATGRYTWEVYIDRAGSHEFLACSCIVLDMAMIIITGSPCDCKIFEEYSQRKAKVKWDFFEEIRKAQVISLTLIHWK